MAQDDIESPGAGFERILTMRGAFTSEERESLRIALEEALYLQGRHDLDVQLAHLPELEALIEKFVRVKWLKVVQEIESQRTSQQQSPESDLPAPE